MPDLAGKVALVTGGGRRLGRAIAEALGDDGACLAVHYHTSSAGARQVVDRFGADRASVFQTDLRDAVQAEALPRRVADAMGRLDILVNSAAIMVRQPFGQVTPDGWAAVLDLNLRAPFFVAQGAAPYLRERRGLIVNISDASSRDPWPSYLPHSMSKAGIQILTRGLAQILAPEVRVNGIIPGAVLLPGDYDHDAERRAIERTPLKRLGTAADVVAAVRFLLTTDYATGSTVVVDGGASIKARGDG